MKHIKNSLKNGIYLLEHSGVPVATSTDFSEPIKNGSICVDTTNQEIYLLKNNSWVKIGAGFDKDEWIPRKGTFINKPVIGDIEFSDGYKLYSGLSEILLSDSELIFNYTNFPLTGENTLSLNRNVIFKTDTAILNIDSASKNNYINKVTNTIAPSVSFTNSSDNYINSNLKKPATFNNFNSNNVSGNIGDEITFNNINNSDININSVNDVNISNSSYIKIDSNLTQSDNLVLMNNNYFSLKGLIHGSNSSFQNLEYIFLDGNFKKTKINTGNYINFYGSMNDTEITNVNNFYNIGHITGEETADLLAPFVSNSVFKNINSIYNLGEIGAIDFQNSANVLLLGKNTNLKSSHSTSNLFINNNAYYTNSGSIKNIFINNNSYDFSISGTRSEIVNSVESVYINNGKINGSNSNYNFVVNTDDITIKGSNNFAFTNKGFEGEFLGDNNVIFSLKPIQKTTIHSNVFTFGNIDSSAGMHINDGNVIMGNVKLNSSLTTNNQIFGAKYLQDINHSGQINNIFLNVDDFNVPDSNTVFLPNKFYSINLGRFGLIDTSLITGDRYWQFPDKSGTVALLDDITMGGGGNTTAGNGLTMIGDTIELGGTLTQDTTIEGNTNELIIRSDKAGYYTSEIRSSGNGIYGPPANNIQSYIIGGGTYTNPDVVTGIYQSPATQIFRTISNINNKFSSIQTGISSVILTTSDLNLNKTSNLIISDNNISLNTDPAGGNAVIKTQLLTSDRNYEFPDNSGTIALLSDIVNTTAGNGLTMNGNVVELGGTLTQDTLIDGSNFNLTFDNNITTIDSNKFSVLNTSKGFNFNGLGFNGAVLDLLYDSDNRLLVGGSFTQYNGITYSQRILRLNSDGSVDTTFNFGGTGFDGDVRKIQKQIDGKYIIGGYFTTYNGLSCNTGIVRLNNDGTLDTSFTGGGVPLIPSQYINDIKTLPDGKILVGGEFVSFNSTSVGYIVRLNSDGSIDTTFNFGGAGFNNAVLKLYLLSNNKILVGGRFGIYNGTGCPDLLVKLNYDGSIDDTFNKGGVGFNTPSIGSAILAIKETLDGKLIVGGNHFTQYNGVDCPDRLVRLNMDGSIDNTFNFGGIGFNNQVWNINILSNGKILIGGYFTQYNNITCNGNIVRLNSYGSLDLTFNSGGTGVNNIGSGSRVFVRQTDDKIIIGGVGINSYNNTNVPQNLFRIKSDGTLEDVVNVEVFMDDNHGVLRYEDNYKDYFTQRSLVDKEYVDSKTYSNISNSLKGGHHQYNNLNEIQYIPTELREVGMEASTKINIKPDQTYKYLNLTNYETLVVDNKVFLFMENFGGTPNTIQVLDSTTLNVLNTTTLIAPNNLIPAFRYAGIYDNKIYFSLNDNRVSYFDINTYTLGTFITTASSNNASTYKIHNGILYVMANNDNNVVVIDLKSWSIISNISVTNPYGCDIAEKENKLYIFSDTNATVSVHNLQDYSLITNITVSVPTITSPIQTKGEPHSGYYNGKMYFLGRNTNQVCSIDCESDVVIDTIPVIGLNPINAKIINNKMYSINITSSNMSVIDLDKNITLSLIDFSVYNLLSPITGFDNMVYFSNKLFIPFLNGSGGIAVVNTNTDSVVYTQTGFICRNICVDNNYKIFTSSNVSGLNTYNFTNSDTYILQPDLISWSKETPIVRFGDSLSNSITYEDNSHIKKQLTKKTIPSIGIIEEYLEEVLLYKNSNYREIKTITSNYTVTDDDYMINANVTSGNIVITIPTAVGRRMKEFVFLKTDSSINTVTLSSTVNINGALTKVITTQYDGVTIKSNGVQYFIKK